MKTHLYNQALAHRFGTELNALLELPSYSAFSFAVAWIRSSGAKRLEKSLRGLLGRAGTVRGTVGVDIENTSKEGLEALLSLSAHGDAQFWVYHDENQRTVFHPKIYLLETKTEATLIVGSNNLTESGLYTNTEAGLRVEGKRDDGTIKDAHAMLTAWQDIHSEFVRPLTEDLLEQLVEHRYVMPERTLRQRRMISEGKRKPGRKRLFGTGKVVVPPLPKTGPSVPPAGPPTGSVLLMRVRRASETSRRTQIQVPIRVRRLAFFKNVDSVRSSSSGENHQFRTAHARGNDNTIKLEMPEIASFADPVVRFERDKDVVRYNAFDAKSAEGKQIMGELQAGRGAAANPTALTVPKKPASATWWRFV